MAIRNFFYLFNVYLYVLNDNMRIIRVYKVNTFYYDFIFHALQEKVKPNVNKMRENNLEEAYQPNSNQENAFKSSQTKFRKKRANVWPSEEYILLRLNEYGSKYITQQLK